MRIINIIKARYSKKYFGLGKGVVSIKLVANHVPINKMLGSQSVCCDNTLWVTEKAMELMGSYGYAFDYHIEKYLRDVKILQLWLGGPQCAMLDTALGYYDFEW